MFRFTIRDAMWLMVVVGLGTAWAVDRTRLAREARDNLGIAESLKLWKDSLEAKNYELQVLLDKADPDWKVRAPFLPGDP